MASDSDGPESDPDGDRLATLRAATSLAELVELTGAADEHEAYFRAKTEWAELRGAELAAEDDGSPDESPVPGTTVVVDGHSFHVHGVTHAGTDAEAEFLQERLARRLDDDTVVYCEQGIRSMYFEEFPEICEMDDYRWAMRECSKLDVESHLQDVSPDGFEGIAEEVDSLASQLREATFSLVESGSDLYGQQFASALGDVASSFLTSHTDVATGDDFESFRLSKTAAENPHEGLAPLQRYYERTFLPQPLEREWLRRHDPELEIMTHARNERMADYAIYHNDEATDVHLVVGAAHQPGVRYYLEQYRDGKRARGQYEPVV